MNRLLITSTAAILLLGGSANGRAAPVTLKIATVMPRGGPWANAISRFAAQVKKQTRGQVVFKIYFGAVAGTEQRALSRMKAGQIQGLMAATAALSSIDSTIRVLELPLLYRSYKEFRFVLKSMEPIFKKRYKKRGYRLLVMASVGWIYLYSKKPIRSLSELKRCKIWRWKHDPLATAMFKIMGMRGHKLPVTDVLASLQAGTIDTVYGMPHYTQALQWHTSVKYALDFRITMAIGSMLVRNDAFAKLTPGQQKIVENQALAMQSLMKAPAEAAQHHVPAGRSQEDQGPAHPVPRHLLQHLIGPAAVALALQGLGACVDEPAPTARSSEVVLPNLSSPGRRPARPLPPAPGPATAACDEPAGGPLAGAGGRRLGGATVGLAGPDDPGSAPGPTVPHGPPAGRPERSGGANAAGRGSGSPAPRRREQARGAAHGPAR
jgi:TRAP-type C4-dicarboxylate transport system substrate-binding protein